MTKFRHLIWMTVAAACLMLSPSQSYAQQRQADVGDQPGLMPDDTVQLDPEFRKQVVSTAPMRRRAPSSSPPPSAISIWSRATAARCAMASASAAKVFSGRGW